MSYIEGWERKKVLVYISKEALRPFHSHLSTYSQVKNLEYLLEILQKQIEICKFFLCCIFFTISMSQVTIKRSVQWFCIFHAFIKKYLILQDGLFFFLNIILMIQWWLLSIDFPSLFKAIIFNIISFIDR